MCIRDRKKIARDTRNREKLAGDDWVMAEFYATWCPHCQRMQPLIKEFKKEMEGIVEVVQVDVDEDVYKRQGNYHTFPCLLRSGGHALSVRL